MGLLNPVNLGEPDANGLVWIRLVGQGRAKATERWSPEPVSWTILVKLSVVPFCTHGNVLALGSLALHDPKADLQVPRNSIGRGLVRLVLWGPGHPDDAFSERSLVHRMSTFHTWAGNNQFVEPVTPALEAWEEVKAWFEVTSVAMRPPVKKKKEIGLYAESDPANPKHFNPEQAWHATLLAAGEGAKADYQADKPLYPVRGV